MCLAARTAGRGAGSAAATAGGTGEGVAVSGAACASVAVCDVDSVAVFGVVSAAVRGAGSAVVCGAVPASGGGVGTQPAKTRPIPNSTSLRRPAPVNRRIFKFPPAGKYPDSLPPDNTQVPARRIIPESTGFAMRTAPEAQGNR